MTHRTEALLQAFESIGAPLLSAAASAGVTASPEEEAKIFAGLMDKSVEAGLALGPLVDIENAGDQADSIRLALTALASPQLAQFYMRAGQMPGPAEIKKIHAGFQALAGFVDSYQPGAAHAKRLKNMGADGRPGFDEAQAAVQFLHAMLPVLSVVCAFPFGQPEVKLIADITSKLGEKAAAMRMALFKGAEDPKALELGLLKSMALLYAACHQAETQRLMKMSEEERAGAASLEHVWSAFDLRCAMLEAMAGALVPGGKESQKTTGGSKNPAPLVQTEKAPPAQTAPKVKTPPVVAPSPPLEKREAGGNPLSFFAKNQSGANPADTPSPVTLSETSPSSQSSQSAPSENAQQIPQNNPQKSPMGFFKNPSTKSEDS